MLENTPEAFEAFFNEFTDERLGGLPEHAKTWARAALENKLLLLNVPPRSAKTTIMAVWFSIWQFARSRNTQVIILSKTGGFGAKISRKISAELEGNVKLLKAFGRFRPQDSSRPWRVATGELELEGKDLSIRTGDLNLQIRGSGQQILGMEADWLIADDLTDRRVALSEADREKEWEFFLGEAMTRLAPGGKAFCIGQRVHSEDIYGRLGRLQDETSGEPIWHMIRTPAILDEEAEKVLWPGLWPYSEMVAKRKEIGGPLFNCMYQQAPEISGEFVKRWWLTGNGSEETPGCFDYDRTVGQGWKRDANATFVPVTRVISIDPSPTMYAGVVVADIVYTPQTPYFYCALVDIVRDKMGLREMVEVIKEKTAQHRPTVCIFETNAAKWLHEDPTWNRLVPMFVSVVGHSTTRHNKQDALLGVWSLASDFEAGRIRFPYSTPEDREVSEHLISEVLAYPNGQTDDVLMALWFIKANYKRLIPRDMLPTKFDRGFSRGRTWDMDRLAAAGGWRRS